MGEDKEKLKDGVEIHTNSQGEQFAIFERFNQMFPILSAIRGDLWDLADYHADHTRSDKALPVRITWRIEKYVKCQEKEKEEDVETQASQVSQE